MVLPPTGTITFLFTDIEKSSRLWEDRPDDMKRAVEHHDGIIRTAIEEHDGYVFAVTGDGFGGAFSDPLKAAVAAADAQLALTQGPSQEDGLTVRMGLHTGVAQERGGNYFGRAVNRAARIADAGHGGQILLGKVTTDLLAGQLPQGFALQSLGDHRLKDLAAPEAIHQLLHASLPSNFAPLRTLDGHLNNLPIELSSFVGRRDELAAIAERLATARLVTLTGVGGAGKTRLALHSAAETFHRFPDGVWLVELASVVDRDGVAARVVETLGLQPQSAPEPGRAERMAEEEAIEAFLHDRRALVILDNCEHVIDSAAELAENLLQACQDLHIIATSREGLGIRGEHIIRVPSLAVPAAGPGDDNSKYPDAMELFAERASAVSPFRLDEDTAPLVAEICRRLDGIPLAIELAAARAQVLAVDQILARLTDVFRLLTGGARTALPRQQTLVATIDWSYQLLDDRERRVFERLAVFAGGFTMEAAEAIVGGDGIDEAGVFDIVTSLAEKSMVQARSNTGRFVLLETLRQFARGRLGDAGDSEIWRGRHADHFAAVAEAAHDGTRSADQIAWFKRLDADHENLKAAYAWAVNGGAIETAARIANGLWWFWGARGHADVGLSHIRRLLKRDDLPVALRAGLLTGAAYLEFEGGDIAASLPAGEDAVALSRTLDDPKALALALIYWANTAAANFGMKDEAHAAYKEGYDLGRRLGNEWLMGWHALNDGWIHRYANETEEAERLLLVARDHLRRAGVAVGLAWAVAGIGAVRAQAGDIETSVDFFEEARELHASYDNPSGESWALFALARALSLLGRHDSALESAEAAMALLRRITKNYVWGEVLASVHRRRGDPRAALETLEAYADEVGTDPSGELLMAGLLAELGLLAGAAGGHHLAATLLARGEALRRRHIEPSPSQQKEWDEAWADIERHLPQADRIREEGSTGTYEEAKALAAEAFAKVRSILEAPPDPDRTS
ncbi:MAG TPA: adenylate/guanylate cyclase domain-containing protein [Acidimicrobiia bacterium]|nr:adenylate/guanylate cyclase domain-containing protein [Acidimicrobiia bacterium]